MQVHSLLQSFIGEVLAKYWGKHCLPHDRVFAVYLELAQACITAALTYAHPEHADRTPTAVTIMGLMQSLLGGSSPIYFDHLAFRTFAVGTLSHSMLSKVS